jgi:hypothetical protein
MVLGTAKASTSGTSVDFTDIPSWVKRVTVMLQEVSTSGTSYLLAQIGSGSVDTTGYTSTYSAVGGTNTCAVNNSTAGFHIITVAATDVKSGIIQLVSLGSNNWVGSWTMKSSTTYQGNGAGAKTLSGALDRIRITTVNGADTFDAGSINILYEG